MPSNEEYADRTRAVREASAVYVASLRQAKQQTGHLSQVGQITTALLTLFSKNLYKGVSLLGAARKAQQTACKSLVAASAKFSHGNTYAKYQDTGIRLCCLPH